MSVLRAEHIMLWAPSVHPELLTACMDFSETLHSDSLRDPQHVRSLLGHWFKCQGQSQGQGHFGNKLTKNFNPAIIASYRLHGFQVNITQWIPEGLSRYHKTRVFIFSSSGQKSRAFYITEKLTKSVTENLFAITSYSGRGFQWNITQCPWGKRHHKPN